MRLREKVCLITGGAAGIGRATAAKFAGEGARVVIGDLGEAAGQEAVASPGEAAAFFRVNVVDRPAVQAWVDAVVDEYGRIDVLVNNAGITRDAQLVKFKDGELGRYGIRVNAVAPGFIATEMTDAMPEKVLDNMRGHTPLRRMGRPEDVANAYAFLASDEASFISGAVLRVDGGIVIGT
jgi:NAD(P)-dependent dehydrogenase (short-subunit alcohol dehydrogenase family)